MGGTRKKIRGRNGTIVVAFWEGVGRGVPGRQNCLQFVSGKAVFGAGHVSNAFGSTSRRKVPMIYRHLSQINWPQRGVEK